MDTEKLKQIKIGHPFRYGPYMIDRYMAGNGLGWIVKPPEGKPFVSRDLEKVLRYITTGEGEDDK